MNAEQERDLRALIIASERKDGTPVYTATLHKLPGIVVEGDTPEEAQENLRQVVERLHRTVGIPEEAFEKDRGDRVEAWSWKAYTDWPRGKAPEVDRQAFSLRRPLATV